MKKIEFNKRDRKKIVSLYLKSYNSIKSIAETFGVSDRIIRRTLEEEGCAVRGPGRMSK